jgi:hypothetical protein
MLRQHNCAVRRPPGEGYDISKGRNQIGVRTMERGIRHQPLKCAGNHRSGRTRKKQNGCSNFLGFGSPTYTAIEQSGSTAFGAAVIG